MTARPSREHLARGSARHSVRLPPGPRQKATIESACIRLHELYGESPVTWQNRIFGAASDYQHVAQINAVLRTTGCPDKVAELMVPIEASVAASPTVGVNLELRAARADALEDVREA